MQLFIFRNRFYETSRVVVLAAERNWSQWAKIAGEDSGRRKTPKKIGIAECPMDSIYKTGDIVRI